MSVIGSVSDRETHEEEEVTVAQEARDGKGEADNPLAS